MSNENSTIDNQSNEGIDAPELTTGLRTLWANSVALPSFDADQIDIALWSQADLDTQTDLKGHQSDGALALEEHMTLADAEELIATARSVAKEHEKRAEAARHLADRIALRLGREAVYVNRSAPAIAPETEWTEPLESPFIPQYVEPAEPESLNTATTALPVADLDTAAMGVSGADAPVKTRASWIKRG